MASVLVQGAQERTIVFPPGTWRGDDGSVVQGPTTATVAAPLARLPWYRRQERGVGTRLGVLTAEDEGRIRRD